MTSFNKLKTVLFFAFPFFAVFSLISSVFASCPSTDYDCQIAEIQREIDALKPAHENNKEEYTNLQKQLKSLKSRIADISKSLVELGTRIDERERDLAYTKNIFQEKANSHYRFIRIYDPLLPFINSENASQAFVEASIMVRLQDKSRIIMENYAAELIELRKDRDSLKKNRDNLAKAQASVDARAKFLEGEIKEVESHIARLSSRQEELLALKAGGFSTSIGDTPETLEPCSGPPGSSNFCDPGFRPAFAGFSFGAPHRTGMSQYGAFGRAKSGQSAEAILSAYYQGAELNKAYSIPDTIGVSGYGRIPFEDNYLLGIYEVPERWGDDGGFEALKAQAVAARSYALAVTNNGAGTICPTESCQVYKPQLKSGRWAEAVRATRGWVLMKDGLPAKAYYASTSGGFTVSQWGWSGIKDTIGEWPGTAYEKIAGSPWFYKGWYKSRSGVSCGRSNPWLTSEETADILNAWKVLYQGGGDSSRVSPIGDCWGGNPYSRGELASIGGFNSVSGVSVVYSNSGFTQTVTFSTNKGTVSMSGEELKRAFNLRAPGYIGIKSSLFNIEKL